VTACVRAQGEDTFREIVLRLADGRSLTGVHGSVHREGGKVNVEPKRALRDLNEFPAHDYSLLDVPRYFEAKKRRQLDYISSQGCRFRCTFCADPYVYERGWSGLDSKRMGEELETLWRRYRFDDLNFQDETYFTHRERVTEVSEELLQEKRAPPRDGGRRVGLTGDDGLAQEGHQDRASLRDRRHHGAPRHCRHLPIHRRLPRRNR
jgi:radical SAM superfamily enzyme YgiQ (UPF0313 family)